MHVLRHGSSTFRDENLFAADYALAVEEPLEIYVEGAPYSVTMRSPGDDVSLAAGFCFTQGIVESWSDFLSIDPCESTANQARITVRLNGGTFRTEDRAAEKKKVNRLSAGLCSEENATDGFLRMYPVRWHDPICLSDIWLLKSAYDIKQELWEITGATHSTSIFSRSQNLLAFAEDVGRQNAFDKAVGKLLREESLKDAYLAIVSSRLNFEILKKAGRVGLQILAGLSAPTSMAVSMAEDLNITLIGFLRDKSLTIYTHPERIITDNSDAKD